MTPVVICFVTPQRKISITTYTFSLNKANKQHDSLLITYDVRFGHNTASKPFVDGVVIDVLNIIEA